MRECREIRCTRGCPLDGDCRSQVEYDQRHPPEVKDGYEVPPPVHSDGHDTEQEAADKVAPVAKKLRTKVRDLAYAAGREGITAWESVVALGMENHEYSVRPRLTELCEEKHGFLLTKSDGRRLNHHGNREIVYVATSFLTYYERQRFAGTAPQGAAAQAEDPQEEDLTRNQRGP